MLGPFIMVDELIYSELGRSLAATGGLFVRDVPSSGYGAVYPLLIAPAYLVFDNLTDAYAAVKTLNALFMSLAAVPAYLLARRVVGPPLSLLCAVLTVAVPSLVYTGSVMTENAFYPLFLVVALLLVLVLERPTTWTQLGLAVALGVAVGTRIQAVVLVAAALTAPLLLALLERRSVRSTLSLYRWLYVAALVLGALTVAGHTHGGQVRLFGYAPVVPSRFGARYAYGHVVEAGRNLVVSGGLGCSGIPVRFGLGFGLGGGAVPLPNPNSCYWGGYGGSLVINDLDAGTTFAYAMNRMAGTTTGDMRAFGLCMAMWGAMAG